jgi:hippurate hydrolase
MHACGHDGHTAMLLGSAMILSRLRRGIKGNVKFLFQPAEETVGGAEAMIRAGCLERPRVDAVFALHLRPSKPFGAVAIRPGPMSAAALQFLITVKGRGGHAAGPHATIDPLVAANHIYQAFHTLSRNIDALDPCVVSVCSFHAGTAFNVIPDDAEMKGTIRTYKTSVEATIRRRMRAIVRGAAQAFGAKCRIEFIEGTRAVVNNAALTRLVLAASRRLGLRVVDVAPSMGSEDFSCYLKSAPGAFIRLGTQKGAAIRLQHSSKFDFDDTVLAKGAALLSECALLSLAEA